MYGNHYFTRGALLMGAAVHAVVQSTYATREPAALPGMVANETEYNIDTCICETVAGIGFGLAVSQGTGDKGAILGGASAPVFRGIAVRDVTLDVSNLDKYPRYANMAVLTMGDIWVKVSGGVTPGANVTFLSTTGVLGTVAADGTHFAIAGARWMTTANDGELAILRLTGNLPSA